MSTAKIDSPLHPIDFIKSIFIGVAFMALVSHNLYLQQRNIVSPMQVYLEVQALKMSAELHKADVIKELHKAKRELNEEIINQREKSTVSKTLHNSDIRNMDIHGSLQSTNR